jgi:hypothetical protein
MYAFRPAAQSTALWLGVTSCSPRPMSSQLRFFFSITFVFFFFFSLVFALCVSKGCFAQWQTLLHPTRSVVKTLILLLELEMKLLKNLVNQQTRIDGQPNRGPTDLPQVKPRRSNLYIRHHNKQGAGAQHPPTRPLHSTMHHRHHGRQHRLETMRLCFLRTKSPSLLRRTAAHTLLQTRFRPSRFPAPRLSRHLRIPRRVRLIEDQ